MCQTSSRIFFLGERCGIYYTNTGSNYEAIGYVLNYYCENATDMAKPPRVKKEVVHVAEVVKKYRAS